MGTALEWRRRPSKEHRLKKGLGRHFRLGLTALKNAPNLPPGAKKLGYFPLDRVGTSAFWSGVHPYRESFLFELRLDHELGVLAHQEFWLDHACGRKGGLDKLLHNRNGISVVRTLMPKRRCIAILLQPSRSYAGR